MSEQQNTQIEIEINGQKIKTDPNKMIIEVADEQNIYIPRFCYHKKLSVAANCRMCLVEVEKAPKTLPACATPIADGMKVFTQSEKALESQKIIMEFLLLNHPLDCPICDQGGQCELQDFSMGYGQDKSYYKEAKRAVNSDDLGPLIATEMTRCIHCTRCVRFGAEVAGVREMGATYRGEHTKIGTYVKHTVAHELSGNIIDLCPVGALTSKPFEFKARAWELAQHTSIAPHDGLGSNIFIHTRRNQVMRVVPKENEKINEAWLSDRDRFSYLGLNQNRLALPMIKQNNQWHEVTWQEALNYTADALDKIKHHHGKNSIAALISANNSLEEVFLLKQILNKNLDSELIDYRVRQANKFNVMPSLGVSNLSAIEKQEAILIIGSHLRQETPLLAHRIRQAAVKNNAKVHMIDMVKFDYAFDLASQQVNKPSEFILPLLKLLKSLMVSVSNKLEVPVELSNILEAVKTDETSQLLAKDLLANQSSYIALGAMALTHPWAEQINYIVTLICELTSSNFGVLAEGANSRGLSTIGAVCEQHFSQSKAKAFILDGIEPNYDVANPVKITHVLKEAEFSVAITSFKSESLMECVDVMLPKAAFAETSGTYINLANQQQTFQGAVKPFGEARPAWKIYRVLGNLFGDEECSYESSEEVLKDCLESAANNRVETSSVNTPEKFDFSHPEGLERISSVASYSADMLVRRSIALQEISQSKGELTSLYIHSETAKKHGVQNGMNIHLSQESNHTANFTAVINNAVPEGAVFTYAGIDALKNLEGLFAIVDINTQGNNQ